MMETQDQAFARRVKEGYERQRRNRMSDEVRGIVEAGERVREAVAQWPPASGDRERWARWDQLLQGIGEVNEKLIDLTAELVDQRNALQARVEQLEQELYSRSESNGG